MLTPLPIPPSRADTTNFSTRADAFLGALPNFQQEVNALIPNINSASTNATQAASSAASALTSSQQAQGFRNEAQTARDEAVAAVASLPEGSINDMLVTLTNAYSAVKIQALLADLSASNLTSGTIPNARFPSTLPALNGQNLTDLRNLNASQLTTGTVPDARFPSTLPAVSGQNLTNLNASNLTSGTIPVARLPGNILQSTGGTAPYYGVRAAGAFNMQNSTTILGLNLTFQKGPVGEITVTFQVPMHTANYAVTYGTGTANGNYVVEVLSRTVNSFMIRVKDPELALNNGIDLPYLSVHVVV